MGVRDVCLEARPLEVDVSRLAFHFLLQVTRVRAAPTVYKAPSVLSPSLIEGRLPAFRRPRARVQTRHEGFRKSHLPSVSWLTLYIALGVENRRDVPVAAEAGRGPAGGPG